MVALACVTSATRRIVARMATVFKSSVLVALNVCRNGISIHFVITGRRSRVLILWV